MIVPHDGRIRFPGFTDNDVKLFVTGDLCPLGGMEEKFLADQGEWVYGKMLEEMVDKDLSLTNLELALTRGGEPIDKCGPCLRADPGIFPAMAKADFDVYGVANNHSRDWGNEAFLETLAHIEAAGKQHVGGGRNADDAAGLLRLEVKGLNLALLAVTMHTPCDAGPETPGANALDPARNAVAIREARDAGDLVMVYLHDGKEHVSFPSGRIRSLCRAFVEAGACAVIGHHPHISRGFERYRDALIAYSLGNFMFPVREDVLSPKPRSWFESYSLRLRIGPSGVTGLDVLPHRLDPAENRLNIMSGPDRKRFLNRLNRLNEILIEPGENERYFSAAAQRFSSMYAQRLQRFCRDQLEGNPNAAEAAENGLRFHHYLNTEEHWDVLDALGYRQHHGITDVPDDLEALTS